MNKEEIPKTNKILAIFDPIIFPNVSSLTPFMTASTETNNSQREVPKPITIIPRNISDKLNFFPKAIAELIRRSAPHKTRIKPKTSSKKNILVTVYNNRRFRIYLIQVFK